MKPESPAVAEKREARRRIEQAVRFVSTDFETFAKLVGLPEERVRQTLYNMRRAHVIAHVGWVRSPKNPRAKRRVYGPCMSEPASPTAALAGALCQAWR